jgi:hypothetical protein
MNELSNERERNGIIIKIEEHPERKASTFGIDSKTGRSTVSSYAAICAKG